MSSSARTVSPPCRSTQLTCRNRLQLTTVPAILVLLVTLVGAQTPQLSGTARDEKGKPLPGVTITVSGSAIDTVRRTTTDARGTFTFADLPSGDGYVLTFSLTGFQAVVRRNVQIGSDAGATIDAVMRIQSDPAPRRAPAPPRPPRGGGIILLSKT